MVDSRVGFALGVVAVVLAGLFVVPLVCLQGKMERRGE